MGNDKGVKIKLKVNLREKPILSARCRSWRKSISSYSRLRPSPMEKSSPKRRERPHSAQKSATFTIYRRLSERIVENGKDYDLSDLTNLLRKDQRRNLQDMIRRAKDGFRFLDQVTEPERKITHDRGRHCKDEVEQLKAHAIKRAG